MATNLYDELDPLYRAIWGTSLHHGLWITGHESTDEARQNLINKAISILTPKGTIADIGCGYGTFAKHLVENHPCQLIANTNATAQAALIPAHPKLTLAPGNWLDQKLPAQSLDSAVAIESLSHFPSFDQFIAHTASSLKPDARLIIADWFSDSGKTPLLRYLSSIGQIPPWRSLNSLIRTAKNYKLQLTHSQNLSQQAAPTWSHLFSKSLFLSLRKPSLLPTLVSQSFKHPGLLTAFPLIRLAYQTGDLQYHLLSFKK